MLLLREAVSCCCCCPVFAKNPGLAALSGPHCSLRRPRPPLPHSLPCTEGGVGKTCLSSPSPPIPGMLEEVEAFAGVCTGQAGRPADGPVQTCRPVPPPPGSRLKWPPTRGWGCHRLDLDQIMRMLLQGRVQKICTDPFPVGQRLSASLLPAPVPQIPTPRMALAARVRRAGRAAAAASLPTSRILWGGRRQGAEAECLQTPWRANPHCEAAACHRIKWLRADQQS